MNKFITLIIILSAFVYPKASNAENSDAKSVALGGTTTVSPSGAFTPLRNPASMTNLTESYFILPFSPYLNIGSNFGNLNMFIPKNNSSEAMENQENYFLNIVDNLYKNNNQGRLELQTIVPIVGFSGAPFPKLTNAKKPIYFGLNLWLKGTAIADLKFSDGIIDIMKQSSRLIDDVEPFPQKISEISGWSANLTKGNFYFPDFSKYKDINFLSQSEIIIKATSAISDVEKLQNQTLKPIIENSTLILNSLDKLSTTVRDSLDLFDKFNKNRQNTKGQIIVDGHAVIAFSAAGRLFKNDDIDLSVGMNVKGLFFPVNFSNNIFDTKTNPNILPVTINADLNLGPFKSIEDVKKIIDDQFNPVLEDAKSLLTTAEDVDRGITYILPKLKDNPITAAPDVPALEVDITRLQNKFNDISKKASVDIANQTISKIKKVLEKEIKEVKLDYSQITDVSPFGVGFDLGAEAKFGEDFTLGLVLENPLVIWPAKLKRTQITLDPEQLPLEAGKKFEVDKFIKYTELQKPEYTNYNSSEPFAFKLGGSYKLDKLFQTKDTFIFTDIEQVFNGRPLALHVGFEKAWKWQKGIVFGRAGLQIGGLGNLVTMGLGVKSGMFSIDIGYGANSPLEPLNSYTSILAVSTSLSY